MRGIAWTGSSVVIVNLAPAELETWSLPAGASGWTNGSPWTHATVAPQQSSSSGEELQSPAVAGSRGAVSVVAMSGNDLFFWLQGAGAATTTTTATTTANSTSVTVVSGTGLAANQTITIAGAGTSGGTYTGMIVSGSGTSWVVSPGTPTAQTGGALVTSPFSGPQTLASISGAAPDMVGAGENAFIVHNDGEGILWYYTRWTGGFPFPPFPQAPERIADPPAGAIYDQASIAYADDGLVVAAMGTFNNIPSIYFWWRFFDSGWNEVPQQLPVGTLPSGAPIYCSAPSIAWTGTSVVIVALGSDNNIYYWWVKAGATNWSQPAKPPNPHGVTSLSFPAIAWTGNSVAMTAAGADNNIYYWSSEGAGAANWSSDSPKKLGNPTRASFSPTGIAWTGSSVVISGVDASKLHVYCWSSADDFNQPQLVNAP
jgi:hypothetical protein